MSLRPLMNAVQICQKQRTILSVYKNWFHPVSLSALQFSSKGESATGDAESSLGNERILDKEPSHKENYEYYKKFVGIVKDHDKKTVVELKTSQATEGEYHSPSVTNLLPDAITRNKLTAYPVKDPSPETETLRTVPDSSKFIKDEKSHRGLSRYSDPIEDSSEITGPFIQFDKPTQNTSDVTLPSDPEEAMLAMNRRHYTEIETSYNLAVYVNESETLKKLVSLGVDLSVIEKVRGAANLIIKLDFESDVKPYLLFLKDAGIPGDKFAEIITKNPLIFQTSIEDLKAVIQYFKSKNFSETDLPQIVIRAPRLLLMPISRIDGKLGFYQKIFQLNGNQVREVISRLPKLITYDAKAIKDIHFQMKEFLGFTNSDLQKMFLISPRIFLSNKHNLTNVFDYLHNEMGLSHAHLIQWPRIFRTRLHRIKERHEFLKHMKRHQYDSGQANYVSLNALVSDDDKTFCLNIAKSSTIEFNQFLKTL